MDRVSTLLLEALKASLSEEQVSWEEEITGVQWKELFQKAEDHQILPMIFEAVYNCPSIQSCDPGILALVRSNIRRGVTLQTMKTMEFLALYKQLRSVGVPPCVVKGIICRNLYPKPDYRYSGDEDIYIPEEQFPSCCEVMLSNGMIPADKEQNMQKDYEVPFSRKGSPLYIEVHKHMFAPDEAAYCEFNRYFDDVHDRLIRLNIGGTELLAMPHTDHFFFLICHAFKHFIHGGFGIRQVCDIFRYAEVYGDQIDWDYVYSACREVRADVFAAAMLKIGQVYLNFDSEKAHLTEQWLKLMQVDPTHMAEDLLAAGVFGQAEESRKQSSTITVSAITAQKQGRKKRSGVMSALFPPRYTLSGRYPYLHKYPFLLPAAWGSRMIGFMLHRKERGTDVSKSLEIGNERLNLMKEYGILK